MEKSSEKEYPWGDTRRYNSYKHFLLKRFGKRIQKLTLDAGFTCPNRDGTTGNGGCTFCLNAAFNPSYCNPQKSVVQQLNEGIEFHQNRYRRADGYLAYFQAYSNTYAPLDRLKEIYQPAIDNPLIKGIVIGTRPDCMDDEKLAYFAELQEKMFVSIEYGVETIHNKTLLRINRGHDFEKTLETLEKTAAHHLHTGIHLIFGLPGENPDKWIDDLKVINSLPINSIKFHQLQIIAGTEMEKEFMERPDDFYILNMDNYISFIVDYVERLNPEFVIERFAGEVPPRYLSVNHWGTVRYDVVLQMIEKEMERRDTWQGKTFPQFTFFL